MNLSFRGGEKTGKLFSGETGNDFEQTTKKTIFAAQKGPVV